MMKNVPELAALSEPLLAVLALVGTLASVDATVNN